MLRVGPPIDPHDKAAEDARATGAQLRDAAIALGYVTGAGLDQWVRPEDRVAPAAV